MTPLAAGFAAKDLLILTTSSSVATGLPHLKFIIWADQMLNRRAMFWHLNEAWRKRQRCTKQILAVVDEVLGVSKPYCT